MGWKQFVRGVNAAARRSERAELRRSRELERERLRQAKTSQRQQAADVVNQFDNYLALLVSLHVDCGDAWDWQRISMTPPPDAPEGEDGLEPFARLALASYQPTFFARLFGEAKKTIARLEMEVSEAAVVDQRARDRALATHRRAMALWNTSVGLAPGVLRLDLAACRAALEHTGAFDELRAFQTVVELESIGREGAAVVCRVQDSEIVPAEELRLTGGGKLSTRAMSLSRYWAVYRDHVSSCVLRVARETFAALPVANATIHVQVGSVTIVEARIDRVTLQRSSFAVPDVSNVLAAFPHRMEFRKTTGFQPLAALAREPQSERIVLDEEQSGPIQDAQRAAEYERAFVAWLRSHMAERDDVQFKIKTLVNKLGRYRAEQRLTLKAVQDLAEVLASAGYQTEPELRGAARSPGIDTRISLSRTRTVEERAATAYREAVRWVALAKFLWGAGFRKLAVSSRTRRPPFGTAPVETVAELLELLTPPSKQHLSALETLVATGALESWLGEAQHDSRLAQLASAIRRDPDARKAERWLGQAQAM